MIVIGMFIIFTYFLGRMMLIIIGVYKGPVLRASYKYGDREQYYESLPQILMWLGLWSIASGILLASVVPNSFVPMQTVGFFLLFFAAIAGAYPLIGLRFFKYPTWYFDLIEETGRQERRRIAYMWLKLPPRLRFLYNSNTHAFRQWTDMVILSTIF